MGKPFRNDLTASDVRDQLVYNADTGVMKWRHSIDLQGKQRINGAEKAGCIDGGGYCLIKIFGRQYHMHRVIWLYVHEVWPVDCIDHINGIRSDNRLDNLREATKSQNNWNSRLSRGNKSGFKGVRQAGKRWSAYIKQSGRQVYLGTFDTPEEAACAYKQAAEARFGEFSRMS